MIVEKTLQDTAEEAEKKAEKVLDDPIVEDAPDQIKSVLNDALEQALDAKLMDEKTWQNVLFVGEAGTGKTARIKQWAKENNVNLVTVLASVMDDTDLGGAISPDETHSKVTRLATTEFDELDDVPRSVLFLDEFNRAPQSVRGTLLSLIQDHTVRDDRVRGKQRELKNFLFTIAAVNPNTEDYDTDQLDTAELTRFNNIDVVQDAMSYKSYIDKHYNEMAKKARDILKSEPKALAYEGRKAMADAILTSKDFKFDDREAIINARDNGNSLPLNYRTFKNVLDASNGTKEDLLNKWNNFANSNDKPMIERILRNYKDIEDKANDALKHNSKSDVFAKGNGNMWNKIENKMDGE